jgi:hypothetical protein
MTNDVGAEERLRALLAGNAAALAALDELVKDREAERYEGQLWPHVREYNRDIAAILGHACAVPTHFLHTSWSLGTPTGDLHNRYLDKVFVSVEEGLIEDLLARGIDGSIVEFGVFRGFMLGKLLDKVESLGARRRFYGFDSFEGLSRPSTDHDYEGWQEGQFKTTFEIAAANLRLSERPHLSLIKGWLNDSLKGPEAQAIRPVAYARIDVDIYEPARDCLIFLSDRLADGAILVFDDWPYTSQKGESKAFIDWVKTVPHLRFEWIGQCSARIYFRVHHR